VAGGYDFSESDPNNEQQRGAARITPLTMEDPSEYEKLRLRNMARNKRIMGSLGLEDAQPKRAPALKCAKAAKKEADAAPRRSGRNSSAPDYTGEKIIAANDDDDNDDLGAYRAERAAAKVVSARATASRATPAAACKPTSIVALPPASAFSAQGLAERFPGCAVARGPPRRDAPDGAFRFAASLGASSEELKVVASFRPNRSPEEVLRAGAFGGTYFRTISSGVVKRSISGAWRELPAAWVAGLDPAASLARPWKDYSPAANKFGVKSGQTLEDWEASGWISAEDPFGWFQWCVLWLGRSVASRRAWPLPRTRWFHPFSV